MMTKTAAAVIGLLLLTAGTCSKEADYPAEILEVNGVRTVNNPGYPRRPGSRYSLMEDLSIGVIEGDEAYMFNRPFELQVDTDGCIYVLDWGEVNIKVYDARGKHLRTFGRKGQGPGEMDVPVWFVLTSDGRVCLLDSRNRRVTVLDGTGEYISDFRLEGFHADLKADDRDRLYFYKETRKREAEPSDQFQAIPLIKTVFVSNASGEETREVVELRGESIAMRRTPEGGVISLGGTWETVWEVAGDGRIWAGFNGDYKLTVYDTEGRAVLIFGRDCSPVSNPRYDGQPWQYKTMPAFRRGMVFDEQGRIWIELWREEEAEGFLYDVFTPEGIYEEQVLLPQRIRLFKGGRVYGFVRDEEGYSFVKRYRIVSAGGEDSL